MMAHNDNASMYIYARECIIAAVVIREVLNLIRFCQVSEKRPLWGASRVHILL